ncbi:uncharacterized protein LOC102359844 isoform X2 [Latimeria chalumnae]|uniref:uncharacterized protein LOC102359844 isoform X2 n=1 Tax=Latimeria chalumnae TaxID=7897 RepID=UPI0003C1122A|nr:PREDICTED: uncharacterized protein LOC102359844 isoform X2 [Latimeria chalumnae]|eukprot:XP_006013720.1 PREDICTED: uncharacterized protein LOC102359844 isoform X2 [Latimeria chalumnae]
MFKSARKKVTFNENPVFFEGGKLTGQVHSNVIESYFPLIVKQLSLSPLPYRRLKEREVLTTEQIGEIELEDSAELKVTKLLQIVKNGDVQVFSSFCSLLGEMGYWYLAQTLESATEEGGKLYFPGKSSAKDHQVLKEVVLLHQEPDRALREDNLIFGLKVQRLKNEYLKRLDELQEELFLLKRERDMALRERNTARRETEDLQKLNAELQAVTERLQSSMLNTTVKDLGFGVNFLPAITRRTNRSTNLALLFH